jgi:hypothetical protein
MDTKGVPRNSLCHPPDCVRSVQLPNGRIAVNIYRNLEKKLEPAKHDLPGWPETLGGIVMAQAKKANWTVPGNLTQITAEFYDQLVAFKWKWTPSRSCGDTAKAASILDGEMYHAECQVAANAFLLLLTLAPPYGFGATAKLKTYTGEKTLIGVESQSKPSAPNTKRAANTNEGFYSYHPAAGVHGLKPNVFDVATGKMAALYAWTDHKVVKVGGRYYDVCYNASYGTLNEMALAFTLGENCSTLPTKTIEEAVRRVTEFKVMIKNWFQIAYFRSAVPGSEADNAGAKEMGVFAESLFGDEATEPHPYGGLVPISKWTGVV